jgi:hypothetical protein
MCLERCKRVNPYLMAGLAMCLVIGVALAGTAYLAVFFTRRAKADLEQLLAPLAERLNGEYDVDEATVTGKWGGTIAMARMAGAAGGTVRVWQVDLIDAAGGEAWNYVYARPKKGQGAPAIDIVTESQVISGYLAHIDRERIAGLAPDATDWVQVEYSPDGGYVRVARPMHGRNDIPVPERLEADLRFLQEVGDENRALQERLREQDGARAT